VFIKFQRRVFLKDEAGWRQAPAVPLPAGEEEEKKSRISAIEIRK
jgi:hypothetical protein